MKLLLLFLIVSLIINFLIILDSQDTPQQLESKNIDTEEILALNIKSNYLPKAENSNKNHSLVNSDDLVKLFEIGEYKELAILWKELEIQNYIEAHILKKSWLEKCYVWLKKENLLSLRNFIESWLSYSADDYEFLFLQSQIDLFFGDRVKAINDSFFLLEKLSIGQVSFHKENLKSNIQKVLFDLESKGMWDDLIKFIDQILWHMPNEKKYLLKLAEAYYLNGNDNFSKNILETIGHDKKYAKSIGILKSKIYKKNLQNASVLLKKYNSHFLVDGDLNNIKVSLLIDTGATISVITDRFFQKNKSSLSAKYLRSSFINTAGGRIEAPVYLIPIFSIKDYVVKNIEFVVIEFSEDETIDGLLGMNYLKEFKFEIDQDNEILILNPR